MLNIGLLTPEIILNKTLDYIKNNKKIPLNSSEGFIRQVMGWREYMRLVYQVFGKKIRTSNYFNFKNDIPSSFWDGSTGITPIDSIIKNLNQTGYCHHIERLMVLGNFMLLIELHPTKVYEWFMTMFIDAYDWVMVPNVYSMSQFADGGLVTTKPYISGSNYIQKMSDYKKAPWCEVWDGLYWRFILNHKEKFRKNPRSSMMVNLVEKMDKSKLNAHLTNADKFLQSIY
jgi:deoxyribodipyrimidine photolyase-related protein